MVPVADFMVLSLRQKTLLHQLAWPQFSSLFLSSGCDGEDVEQLIYEPHLVPDARLTCEAMPVPDPMYHFKALDRSGGGPHRLKASVGGG